MTKECPQCHAQCPEDQELCGECGCPLDISDLDISEPADSETELERCQDSFKYETDIEQHDVDRIRKEAELGYMHAQYALGLRYEKGDGVVRDLNESRKWFRKAAEQGLVDAQVQLERYSIKDTPKKRSGDAARFSLRGRTTRGVFCKGVMISDVAIILLFGILHVNPFHACLITCLVYACTVPLRVRRLHDRDMSGRWMLAFLVPLALGILGLLFWSALWGVLISFLFTEVLQFVTYGFFTGTWETNRFGLDPLLVEAYGMVDGPMDNSEAALFLGSVIAVLLYFKKKYGCDAIVLPGQPPFYDKWRSLAQSILKMTGKRPILAHALGLIDCTFLGGCEKGALIDKSGIYFVSEDMEFDGWLDWQQFVEKADIARVAHGKIRICSDPKVGLDFSGNLSAVNAIKLFGTILGMASKGKIKPSQIQVVNKRDRIKDFVLDIVLAVVGLTILGLGYWGIKCYAHVQNVEKAFTMWCDHSPYLKMGLGFKSVVSVDVPRWRTYSEYPCSAKIRLARDGEPEKTVDVTFTARRVSSADVLVDTGNAVGAHVALKQGKIDTAMERANKINDDWDVNLGIWGWIGDDYHIRNVEVKE